MAGPYMDQDLQYAELMKNLISPPDEQQQGTVDAQPVRSTLPSTPADEPPNPTLKTRPQAVQTPAQPAPAAQPAAPAIPATVTPNGAEKGPQKTWADYVRAGLDRGMAASDASSKSLSAIQNQPTAESMNAPLEQKRAGLAAPLNPNEKEYRPGMGTRIVRGLRSGLQGLTQGGIPGAIIGAVDPAAFEGGTAYGAPNKQFNIDTARRGQQAASLDQQMKENIDTQKADTDRLSKLATDQRAQATTTLDIGKTATGQENAENNADKVKMQGDLNDIKQQLADQKGLPANDIQLRVAAATEADPAKKKQYQTALDGYIKTENKRFQYQARAQGEPYDERRQALIDAATAEVQKMNDQYDYDADTNTFFDPNSPTKTFSPKEFTDMKNKIATKLDKDLTTKKLRPLGVRFDVKATTPGGQQQAPAQQSQAPASSNNTPQPPPARPKAEMIPGRGANFGGHHWTVDKNGQFQLDDRR